MSNPGVITLAETKIGGGKEFRVEDNLGEAVHIHYNDLRLDLTVRELLELADVCGAAVCAMVRAEGFSLDDFDGDFLLRYAPCLADLVRVERVSVRARELYSIETGIFHIPVRRRIGSLSRPGGTPSGESACLPVLFNDSPILVYGAGQLPRERDGEAEVLRLIFEERRHSPPLHPALDFLFRWDKKRLRALAKRIGKRFL